MMKALAICLTAAATLCFIPAAPAHAGAARTHDGFFLRLSAGGGTAGSKIEVSSADSTIGAASVDLSGTAGDLNLAIGGMVQPNFAVHATIFGWSVSDPDADVTLGSLAASGTLNGTATMSAIGPGVTYYFMPVNIYVSGSLGLGTFRLTGDVEGETKSGFAMDLTLGKEWWVGENWGLGLAGGFTYHSVPDKDVSENWSGTSFALRFSATMN